MSNISGITYANSTEFPEYTGTESSTPQASSGFSTVLAEAMKEEMTHMSVMAGSNSLGMSSGYMPVQMQSQGLEEIILSSASSGQVTDSQAALFMLCMMMQTSQDSDFSMLMQMMAPLLTQIQADSGALRDQITSEENDPYILGLLDWNVLNMNIAGAAGSGLASLPIEFWRPTTPAIISAEEDRSPELYRAVINQFRVETAERYRPFRNGATYCNIFVWDVTSAMGAEIPHYTDTATGKPLIYPDVSGAKSMTALAIDKWLKTHGSDYGWHEVDAETAQRYANEGKPAVTASGNIDHVQIVCPSKDGSYDPIRGVTIAQAGSKVTNYSYITSIYGANSLDKISYFVHD